MPYKGCVFTPSLAYADRIFRHQIGLLRIDILMLDELSRLFIH